MLQWGINRADEMGVEAFIQATVEGKELYENFGFVTKDIMDLKKPGMQGDAEWVKLERRYPLVYRWMERPKSVKNSASNFLERKWLS